MIPKISVIMPAYNASLYIKEAIESVLSQTYTDFEFIIINDGSTDTTLDIIKSFSDKRIILVNNEINLGIIKSRNIGIDLARGKYIAKMDADDISLPSRFEKQFKYLDQNPNVAVIATKLALIDEKGVLQSVWPEDYYVSGINQIKVTLPIINCIGQPTVMMRADIAKEIGYNADYIKNEDWGFWLDVLSKNYTIEKLDEVLLYYRIHSASTTVTENNSGVEIKTIKFKLKYLKNNIFKFNEVSLNVAKSLIKDIAKFPIPLSLRKVFKIINLGPIKLIRQFFRVRKQLGKLQTPVSNIFLFPYYHSGGAERVHASILEVVSNKNSLVFITDTSTSDALLNDFKRSSIILEVNLINQFGPTYNWLKNKIKEICDSNNSIVLFGCNSKFYYQLIKSLPNKLKIIDLIHAFVHEHEPGPEKWSLPVVQKISNRIVISENTIQDFRYLYYKHHINLEYLNKIKNISNFIEEVPFIKKEMKQSLDVLYVGRGSTEKRIHLISKVAKFSKHKNLNINFHFVGNVDGFIPEEDLPYCKIYNEIHDSNEIDKIYKMADILIITSSREGFPMVIMEAMIHGVVPIATNVGGISAHVKTNETGVLIDEKDEQTIVELIIQNLEYFLYNRIILDKLSLKAYNHAQANFRKDVFFKSYDELLS